MAIRSAIADILISISGTAVSEERLHEARIRIDEAARILRRETSVEKASA
jgi:hypothetical protein